jgi:hypothetical protein
MLAHVLAGVLSAVLVHAGSEAITSTQSATGADRAASGLALPLPGGTWCIGQPRGVRCDHVALAGPQPLPAARAWKFTVLDRTVCVGEVPGQARCDVRVDPTKLPNKTS